MLRLPGMKFSLPKEVVAVVALLAKAGWPSYVVGGSVRDLLLGRPVHDWDFTTSALPEEINATFPESFYENNVWHRSVVGEASL